MKRALPREVIFQALEQALVAATKKKYNIEEMDARVASIAKQVITTRIAVGRLWLMKIMKCQLNSWPLAMLKSVV
jgi:hypothetical protein